MQQILSNIRIVFFRLKDTELLTTMGVANSNNDMFNNLLRGCTKVEHMSSTNSYYLAITAEWVKENISGKIGTMYGYYVRWDEASEGSEASPACASENQA